MAAKAKTPKRLNRSVQLGEMIGNTLDPALKRRGFANRDLITNWKVIAPTPYDKIAIPDRLAWPRRDKPDPEGAVLYLRCLEGHGLMLAHEAPAIAAAINRYFGYLLVSTVRLAKEPFIAGPTSQPQRQKDLPAGVAKALHEAVSAVEDDALRAALEKLGRGVLGGKK